MVMRLVRVQQTMERKAVAAALPVDDALRAELIEAVGGDRVRAAVDIRPYGDDDGHDWYLVSDLSGGLHASGQGHAGREDHVLGVGGGGPPPPPPADPGPVRGPRRFWGRGGGPALDPSPPVCPAARA